MKNKMIVALTSLWWANVASASNVADYFAKMNTFSANFQQTVSQDGKVTQKSTGRVQLKKPLKFRWDYQSPEKMQLISDGQRFYHYDIDLAQATSKPVKDVAGSALATLINGKGEIDKMFNIQSFAAPAVERKYPNYSLSWLKRADFFYELTPKQKSGDDAQAKKVVLGLSANNRLTVFYVEDNYGKNVFLFNDVQQNTAIDDKIFRFNPPRGIDVLGE